VPSYLKQTFSGLKVIELTGKLGLITFALSVTLTLKVKTNYCVLNIVLQWLSYLKEISAAFKLWSRHDIVTDG
jgi:hypothetical protein